MICPKCKTDMGEGSEDDIGVLSWCCRNCGIKIYDESGMYDNK